MNKKTKQIICVILVGVIIAGGLLVYVNNIEENDGISRATIADLLSSRSQKKGFEFEAIVLPYDDPYNVLSATPLAAYYENTTLQLRPMLLAGINPSTAESGISKAVSRFLMQYSPAKVLAIGGVGDDVMEELNIFKVITPFISHCHCDTSEALAMAYWEYSDGAIIVEDSQAGYDMAVNVVPIASYLNIPVLIAHDTEDVKDTLKSLNVRYTLICGGLKGYKKTMFFDNITQVQDLIAAGVEHEGQKLSLLKDRMNINEVKYIAMANPKDIDIPEVLDETMEVFTGTVASQSSGSTSNPSSDANAPTHYFTIPEDYTWAKIILDTKVKYSSSAIPGRTPQQDGQRSYTYFGVDSDKDGEMIDDPDNDDHLQFFSPSLGYEDLGTSTHGYTEKPVFRSTGEHAVQLLATLHYQINPWAPLPESTYTITVKAQKLSHPNYPLIPGISSMAPYLAAVRGGLVLANPDFTQFSEKLLENPNCGDPSLNPPLLEQVNAEAYEVKGHLNELLGKLAGTPVKKIDDYTSLANTYKQSLEDPLLIGVIADTNMIPWYYYEAEPQQEHYGSREGYGIPSDNIYSDIDASLTDHFNEIDGSTVSLELGIGRLAGWDAQDVSVLLAKTFFYSDIADKSVGHSGEKFANTAMTTFGTQIPVGFSETVTKKLDKIFSDGGYTVDSTHDGPASDSKISYSVYERSNLIYFCAHGFYYWFVPPGYKDTSVGGGFYPANVNNMEFGPSSIFGASCVTGKIDGLDQTNAISLSFLHSGMVMYVGSSRLSWGGFSPLSTESGETLGAYIGLYMYGYMIGEVYERGPDAFKTVDPVNSYGAALMKAKNLYIQEIGMGNADAHSDTVEEFNIIGDPAFLPHIPSRN